MLQQLFKALILLLAGLLIGLNVAIRLESTGGPSSTHIPTLQEIQALSTLLTSRIEMADVSVTRLDGYLGGVEAALLVRGHVDLGVDLEQAELVDVDADQKTATLRLPEVSVISATIDHAHTRIVALSYRGVWQVNPQPMPAQRAIEQSLAGTQALLTDTGDDPAHRKRAQAKAEAVATAWARSLGWTLTVRWK